MLFLLSIFAWYCLFVPLPFSDRSIAFNKFSKTVRNTRVSPLFYIIVWNLHKLRARIWSRRKDNKTVNTWTKNRHTTTKKYKRNFWILFFIRELFFGCFRRSPCWNEFVGLDLFLGDRSKKKRLKCKDILLKMNCCCYRRLTRTIWNRNSVDDEKIKKNKVRYRREWMGFFGEVLKIPNT